MALFRTFRALRSKIAPRWLTDGEGGLVGYSLDLIADAFMDRAARGMLAGFPQNDPTGETTAPTDALTRMGQDRRVIRGINETDVDYAARLVTWLTDRRTAGNPYTLMRVLAAYTGSTSGVSFRTVDVHGNWYSRSSTGVETAILGPVSSWNWDGDTDAWSRFWVIIYPGTLWIDTAQSWGTAGDWGDATATWGSSTITEEHTRTLQSIVSDWKPAGTKCQNIILAFDPASFDPAAAEPDGLWGKPYKYVANVAVPSRLATALYLDGT